MTYIKRGTSTNRLIFFLILSLSFICQVFRQQISKRIKVFARAHNLQSSHDLLKMGVKSATPEIIESSFIVGSNVMEGLGLSKQTITSLMNYLRENGYENVKKPINVK